MKVDRIPDLWKTKKRIDQDTEKRNAWHAQKKETQISAHSGESMLTRGAFKIQRFRF